MKGNLIRSKLTDLPENSLQKCKLSNFVDYSFKNLWHADVLFESNGVGVIEKAIDGGPKLIAGVILLEPSRDFQGPKLMPICIRKDKHSEEYLPLLFEIVCQIAELRRGSWNLVYSYNSSFWSEANAHLCHLEHPSSKHSLAIPVTHGYNSPFLCRYRRLLSQLKSFPRSVEVDSSVAQTRKELQQRLELVEGLKERHQEKTLRETALLQYPEEDGESLAERVWQAQAILCETPHLSLSQALEEVKLEP